MYVFMCYVYMYAHIYVCIRKRRSSHDHQFLRLYGFGLKMAIRALCNGSIRLSYDPRTINKVLYQPGIGIVCIYNINKCNVEY